MEAIRKISVTKTVPWWWLYDNGAFFSFWARTHVFNSKTVDIKVYEVHDYPTFDTNY